MLQEAEEARIASVHAMNRMQFMLQLTLVALVSVGIATSIKMGTTRRLLEIFFDKNNCRAHSTFSLLTAVCLLFSVNDTNIEENEPFDPTASYKY